MHIWLLGGLVALVIVGGATAVWALRDNPAEPDRVVGVQYLCDAGGGRTYRGRDECEKSITSGARLHVTIRTDGGKTYDVDVDPATKVAIGDRWP